MPDILHHDSPKVADPRVLALGEVPATQNSVAYGGLQNWDVFSSLESASSIAAGSQVTFHAPPSIGLTDIGRSFIKYDCYYDLTAAIPVTAPGVTYTENGPSITFEGTAPQTGAFNAGTASITSFPITGTGYRLMTLTFPAVSSSANSAAQVLTFQATATLDEKYRPRVLGAGQKVGTTAYIDVANNNTNVPVGVTIDSDGTVLISSTVAAGGVDEMTLKGFSITYVADGDDSENPSVTTPPFLPYCVLNDVEVTMNGTVVVPSQGLASPYCAVADIIKNQTGADRDAGDFTQGFVLDSYNAAGSTDLLVNTGGLERQKFYMASAADGASARKFSIIARLENMGLRTRGGLIPPKVDLRIRGRRVNDNFLSQGVAAEITAANPVLKLERARLYVARRMLQPHAMDELTSAWVERPLTLAVERVTANISWYADQIQSANVIGALAGPTPKAVMAFIVRTGAVQGSSDGEKPSMLLRPENGQYVTNCTVSLGGGRTYPLQPISQDSSTQTNSGTMDWGEIYQAYKQVARTDDPFLPASQMSNITPFAFPIQLVNEINGWDEVEDTAVQFNITLGGAAPGDPWALILIAFRDGVIEFTHAGGVSNQ